MNLSSFEKNGFIKANFNSTNINTIKLSEKILTEFLEFNFLHYPLPPSKIKNISQYINFIHMIDVKNKNTQLTSRIYKFLPTLISLNQFVVSSGLVELVKKIMKQAGSESDSDSIKDIKESYGGVSLGTVPLIRIDRPLDKKYKTPWHQDYWFSGVSVDSLVFWAPLGYLNKKMGYLEVLPKPKNSQIFSIKKRKSNMQEPFIPQKKIDEKGKLILNCKFGEFLIFKQSLLHKSGTNISNKVRVSLQIRFNRFNKRKNPETTYVAKYTQFVLDNQKKLLKKQDFFDH
jgi:hypothetical protein